MLNFERKHASFEQRNQLIADNLPHPGSWVLDVGSNTGFTTRFLGDLGHFVLGVEKMEREYVNARKIAGPTSAFMHVDVTPQFFESSPRWSAILLLSVLHRIYAFDGEAAMRDVLRQCGEKTDALFIEGSTRHARYCDQGQPRPGFPNLDNAAAAAWHETLFAQTLGDTWEIKSQHLLEHTRKEKHRILFYLTKKKRKQAAPRFRQGEIAEISPADILFLQFPEFHKLGKLKPPPKGHTTPGTWDQLLDRACYWGARYEQERGDDTGMVSLSRFHFLSALHDRFHTGADWEDTDWLQWIREHRPSRYKSEPQIQRRLAFMDKLYDACLSGRYRFAEDDLPIVNIGRAGRIAIEDGRHRICVAKVAGLDRIPVLVNAVHDEAFAGTAADTA